MDPQQEQFEKAIGDQFFEWFNAQTGAAYSFVRRAGRAPDLVYSDHGVEIFVEISAAYYDRRHAAFVWESARTGKQAAKGWIGSESDQALAQEILNRIVEKSKNDYGAKCILLIFVPPGLTSFEALARLLAQASVPDAIPFDGVYVVGDFPITISSAGGSRVIIVKPLMPD